MSPGRTDVESRTEGQLRGQGDPQGRRFSLGAWKSSWTLKTLSVNDFEKNDNDVRKVMNDVGQLESEENGRTWDF